MNSDVIYDCAVIGGGLGGLTLSINLAKQGYKIILFEKETYPFHKVCGEYISMESWNYLSDLGLPLKDMKLPLINKLVVTAPDGNALNHTLLLGGFGISRYKLDDHLKTLALQAGVDVREDCKVEDVLLKGDIFRVSVMNKFIQSKTVCGSFGKRSNIDIRWKRNFIQKPANKLNNFIAVKYHVTANLPADTISLHNFSDGYCGISRIEDDKYCLCYLTNAANLKKSGSSIQALEENIMCRNPHLRDILSTCTKLYTSPLSISQISFDHKAAVENGVLMIGDAAGLITPLCGNGMSMAMHAGKIAATHIAGYLNKEMSRTQMEKSYAATWQKTFSRRLRSGRIIQSLFGKIWVTNLFIRTMKVFNPLANLLIRQTHGNSF